MLIFYSLFRESEEGEAWYYSTPTQLDELMNTLDSKEFEATLCREIQDFRDEIVRQMEITEKLTEQHKGNKKSYLEVENGKQFQLSSSFSSLFFRLTFIVHVPPSVHR